jgi:hypothetical protein
MLFYYLIRFSVKLWQIISLAFLQVSFLVSFLCLSSIVFIMIYSLFYWRVIFCRYYLLSWIRCLFYFFFRFWTTLLTFRFFLLLFIVKFSFKFSLFLFSSLIIIKSYFFQNCSVQATHMKLICTIFLLILLHLPVCFAMAF